jgi:thymidylate synthase
MQAEKDYLGLLNHVLSHGKLRPDRTGTGTLSVFGYQLDLDISNSVPLLTTKKMAWKSVLRELLWFLKGSTNARLLQEQGVRIWDGNSSRAFLDSRGLSDLPEGDIGAGYGFQWRHFGAEYGTCLDNYENQGIDQIEALIQSLRQDPYSRRHFISAWNPASMHRMALPPCHVSAQFYVETGPEEDEKWLSCHMYQRSVDCFLGLPFNMFSYAALTYVLAKMTGMKPKRLIISMGDVHIYQSHLEAVHTQLARTPIQPPTMSIGEEVNASSSVNDICMTHFILRDYECQPPIKAEMSV